MRNFRQSIRAETSLLFIYIVQPQEPEHTGGRMCAKEVRKINVRISMKRFSVPFQHIPGIGRGDEPGDVERETSFRSALPIIPGRLISCLDGFCAACSIMPSAYPESEIIRRPPLWGGTPAYHGLHANTIYGDKLLGIPTCEFGLRARWHGKSCGFLGMCRVACFVRGWAEDGFSTSV